MPLVELWSAPLPGRIGLVAVHCWFVARPLHDEPERWEVWQRPRAGPRAWGHLHLNLKSPQSGVGGAAPRREGAWSGEAAARILETLRRPELYPHRERYIYWPGPNSNTYVAWVLETAGVEADLDPRAVGKDFLGRWGLGARLRPGRLRLETPLLGLRLDRSTGLELRAFGLTLGVDPAGRLKTPIGRLPAQAPPES
jgi:hypothetical protein